MKWTSDKPYFGKYDRTRVGGLVLVLTWWALLTLMVMLQVPGMWGRVEGSMIVAMLLVLGTVVVFCIAVFLTVCALLCVVAAITSFNCWIQGKSIPFNIWPWS